MPRWDHWNVDQYTGRGAAKKSPSGRPPKYPPARQLVPKNLARRLHDERPGEINWSAHGRTYTPPGPLGPGTALHKPGSQNPNK